MKIEIDIYPWPTRETEDPLAMQGDIYVDGDWHAGFTGPGSERDLFYQATDLLSANWTDWGLGG